MVQENKKKGTFNQSNRVTASRLRRALDTITAGAWNVTSFVCFGSVAIRLIILLHFSPTINAHPFHLEQLIVYLVLGCSRVQQFLRPICVRLRRLLHGPRSALASETHIRTHACLQQQTHTRMRNQLAADGTTTGNIKFAYFNTMLYHIIIMNHNVE